MTRLNENAVELEALDILRGLGYSVLHWPDIAPGEPAAERLEYGQDVLEGRLRDTPLPKLISGELRVGDAEKIAGKRV